MITKTCYDVEPFQLNSSFITNANNILHVFARNAMNLKSAKIYPAQKLALALKRWYCVEYS